MNKRKIIVISGKQFSGKDTSAKILIDFLPDYKIISIAGALKKEFASQKNITLEEIEANKSFYRPELIALGNKRRAENPDYWLNKVIEEEGNLIIPDLRLKHELEVFKEQDAITARIESNRSSRGDRGKLVQESDATETELDDFKDWDYVIENNSGIEVLTEKIKEFANFVLKR